MLTPDPNRRQPDANDPPRNRLWQHLPTGIAVLLMGAFFYAVVSYDDARFRDLKDTNDRRCATKGLKAIVTAQGLGGTTFACVDGEGRPFPLPAATKTD